MRDVLYCYKDEPVRSLLPLDDCAQHLEHGKCFQELLVALDAQLPGADVQLSLTWNLNRVPHVSSDTVLLHVGDERCSVPAASNEFLAVFRTGTQRLSMLDFLRPRMDFVERCLEALRFALKVKSRIVRWLSGVAPLRASTRIFSVPLWPGSYPQSPNRVPLHERTCDISFLGSLGALRHRPVIGNVPTSPKAAARWRMLAAIKQLRIQRPQTTSRVGCDAGGEWPAMVPPEEYASVMEQTKICLCPRGNFAETFRLMEAARAGCVVLTDVLPKEWYLRDHPFIEIDHWSSMPSLVASLLDDPERMSTLSARGPVWWEAHASPQAVASYMAERITRIRG
jgi:hypothetical protein